MVTKRFSRLAAIVLTLGCGVGIAHAQEPHLGIAVSATTLGIGLHAAVPVSDHVNLRAGVKLFGLTHDFDSDGITLAATLKMRSIDALLDWFPTGGGFHVSPGVMFYNGNEVNATATVSGGRSFTLGDQDLISNPANPVSGTATVTFNKVAPELLLGWGNIAGRGTRRWSIPFEFGFAYTRAPIATLNLAGSACATNGTNCRPVATDAGLQADVASQQAKINDNLSKLKAYPLMSVGFSYKF